MSQSVVVQSGPGDIDAVVIDNAHGRAVVSLLGATLIEWTPRAGEPVMWLSERAFFQPGKGIRGGVPICWPWFGAHAGDGDFPQHGIARTRPWRLAATSDGADGSTRAVFRMPLQDEALWPYACTLEYRVSVGPELTLELTTHNTGERPFELSQALHSYFRVGDIERVSVTGLAGLDYLDKPDGYRRKTQQGAVTFAGETDRIYLGTDGECVIHDESMRRRIEIRSHGSRSTVVWNPGRDVAASIGDMHDDGYRRMCCVETANAASDRRRLAAGQAHTLGAVVRVVSDRD